MTSAPCATFTHRLLVCKRHFFEDNGEHGWLTYESDSLQIVFMRANKELPTLNGWSKQPSFGGGEHESSSWVITVSADEFDAIVSRLNENDINVYSRQPHILESGAQQFFALDPMGNTIEIYTEHTK